MTEKILELEDDVNHFKSRIKGLEYDNTKLLEENERLKEEITKNIKTIEHFRHYTGNQCGTKNDYLSSHILDSLEVKDIVSIQNSFGISIDEAVDKYFEMRNNVVNIDSREYSNGVYVEKKV